MSINITTPDSTPPSIIPSLPSIPSRPRPTHACTRCADRKVKCDRQSPCSTCVKHHVECVFNTTHTLPRKRQQRVKDQILLDRLRFYEGLLKEQGIDPNKLPDSPETGSEPSDLPVSQHLPSPTPSFPPFDPRERVYKTQIVHGRQGTFRFVDNILWTRVVEELEDPEEALDISSSDDGSDEEASDDDFDYVLNIQHSPNSTTIDHPPPEEILQLWHLFTENVDPMTKLVHIPTLQQAIQRAAANIADTPPSFETILFAIYAAAIMSLNDRDCKAIFTESRKSLLTRYINATKDALKRAKFMGTSSLVVLQALLIHIVSVRDIYAPRSVWTLTGVALRIAESMGLDCDGSILGLPPFETEMRRRIWWFLKTHDFRTAELCGLAKFRNLDTGNNSTKFPTAINDTDLFSGMTSIEAKNDGLTDICFVSLRYELVRFASIRIAKFREQGLNASQFHLHVVSSVDQDMNKEFNDIEQLLETKYLRYCDPSIPMHFMTMLMARYALNMIRFLSHHPRRWASIEQTPLAERQWVLEISMKLLEQHNMMQTNPTIKQFAWHATFFQQWHALIHVLDTLRTNPLIPEADKAWQLICSIYANTPEMVSDTKKPVYIAVGNLCLKAYSDRESTLQKNGLPPQPTPAIISQLRHSREMARTKRQARIAKSAVDGNGNVQSLSTALEGTNLQPQPRPPGIPDTSNTSTASSSSQPQPPQPPLPNTNIVPNPSQQPYQQQQAERDSFWSTNGFGENYNITDDHGMNNMALDFDFLLPLPQQQQQDQDQPMMQESGFGNGITWDQWDAWLRESNGMSS